MENPKNDQNDDSEIQIAKLRMLANQRASYWSSTDRVLFAERLEQKAACKFINSIHWIEAFGRAVFWRKAERQEGDLFIWWWHLRAASRRANWNTPLLRQGLRIDKSGTVHTALRLESVWLVFSLALFESHEVNRWASPWTLARAIIHDTKRYKIALEPFAFCAKFLKVTKKSVCLAIFSRFWPALLC